MMRKLPNVAKGVLLAVGMLFFAGCAEHFSDSLSETGARTKSSHVAQEEDVRTPPIAKLQQDLMDFSDRYVSALWQELDEYIATEPDVVKQVRAQRLKVALATTSMMIAASQDPRDGLLDMAVFTSAGKWATERYWIPDVLGEKAAGLRAVYDEAEREIQEELKSILTGAQRSDLASLIEAWKKEGPGPREVMDVRLRNLDGVVLKDFEESRSARGLLSNVRRLMGNVNQSLLYGERMMFYIERTPLVLQQQSDLTVNTVAERFPIATINPNFDQWADLANTLPQQINDVIAARQEMLPEVRGSLDSLARITTSLQGTVTAADSLAEKVQKLPFSEADYTAALGGTAASLEKLNQIVEGLNRLVEEDAKAGSEGSRIDQLARILDQRAQAATDEVFRRVALLIALFIGGLLLVAVVVRILFRPRGKGPE